MQQLYVRVPPRLTDETVLNIDSHFLFILAQTEKNLLPQVLQQGAARLADLPAADEAVLIFSASDITLLEATVPASLTGAKLQMALGNVLEDQLLSNLGAAHVAMSSIADKAALNMPRAVAAIDRTWFKTVLQLFADKGYRVNRAVPESLCIPHYDESVSYTVSELEDDSLSCAARTRYSMGLGFVATRDTLDDWLTWLAKEAQVEADALHLVEMTGMEWIRGCVDCPINLCQFEFTQGARSQRPDQDLLKVWRWPLGLAAGLLLVHLGALQIQWAMLRTEKQTLTQEMTQAFKTTFPHMTVVVDPMAQMRRGVAELIGQQSGVGAHDLTSLLGKLGIALNQLNLPAEVILDNFEYRNEALLVTFNVDVATSALNNALAQQGLIGNNTNAATPKPVWQIRWGS